MKYLEINLTKYVQALHAKFYIALLRQIKEDLLNQGIYCICELEDSLSSCQFFSVLIYTFKTIPSKTQVDVII